MWKCHVAAVKSFNHLIWFYTKRILILISKYFSKEVEFLVKHEKKENKVCD